MFRKSIITAAAAALLFLAAPATGFADGGHRGGGHKGGGHGGAYLGGHALGLFLGLGGHAGRHGVRGHGRHGYLRGHGRNLAYGVGRGYSRVYPRGFRASVPYSGRSCHTVYKTEYVDGRRAKIGGTQCYDAFGGTFVVPNSRYVVHYY